MKEPNIPYMQYKWIDINDQMPPTVNEPLYCWITVKEPFGKREVYTAYLISGDFYYTSESNLPVRFEPEAIVAWMPYTEPFPYTGKNTLEVEVDDESL